VTGDVRWPDGRAFAFTIFDDTDNATYEHLAPVYEFLDALGLRTTKSVWPVGGSGSGRIGGRTCENADYRAWTLELQAPGFEIASHGATNETSRRDRRRRAVHTPAAGIVPSHWRDRPAWQGR
jgi:hypothetical protein